MSLQGVVCVLGPMHFLDAEHDLDLVCVPNPQVTVHGPKLLHSLQKAERNHILFKTLV